MKKIQHKIIIFIVLGALIFFFSNDFGLIDIEKTAIITAISIDIDGDYYQVGAQIAVPEATDTNSENQKAVITGKAKTMGGAIRDLGDLTGWFPKLSFCNLIILGESFNGTNVIKVLDYFSRTLKVQDSALIVQSEKSGLDLLQEASPLDHISSFALQKILVKNTGLDKDVAENSVKKFCEGYYSNSSSSYAPIVKILSSIEDSNSGSSGSGTSGDSSGSSSSGDSSGSSSGGGQSTSTEENGATTGSQGSSNKKGNSIFDATTTALYKNGIKVGELDKRLTMAFNVLTISLNETILHIDDVETFGEPISYSATIMKNKASIDLKATENDLQLDIDLNIYCLINDQNATRTDTSFASNVPIKTAVKKKAEQDISTDIYNLIDVCANTGCDILDLQRKLYRYNYKHYFRYKDSLYSALKTSVNVNVSGQK